MHVSGWDPDLASESGDNDVCQPRPLEDRAEKFGVRLALLILSVGLLLAAVWLFAGQSFAKCSAVENSAQRSACYEQLRLSLLKPPAK
jgi:hypothetical protein